MNVVVVASIIERSSYISNLISRLDDQELLEQMMANDLAQLGELEKTKDETKPEIDRDIKDAKAEKAKLKEMVRALT